MTPALKAMVEAMAAEYLRQAENQRERGPREAAWWADKAEIKTEGLFDLEAVARAGLVAIKRAGDFDDVAKAGAKAEPFQMPEGQSFTPGQIVASTCWSAMIDAILKEQL